ncbi:hypothetical protein E3T43_10115 [Cryobacterium sp. Hh7]|uniref:hypothetical protein n=1 Tax=Cryobacterium sp. Hh7 TaxID=1259159 RepID=UPI00106B533E|nr:hypothetical protein [Cryobacterium sp. Hh7]TFD55872.1 hypothetical protein E3T43_10115 [Cryobacterium sp. Hh7]
MSKRTEHVAKGKTANIVSKDRLAISVGELDGVEVGDTVVVLNSVEIKDPDSYAVLGVYHETRLRLRVDSVAEKFSIASVVDQNPTTGGFSALSAALDSTRVRRMKVIVRSESAESESAVWVEPGEPVVVTRSIEVED